MHIVQPPLLSYNEFFYLDKHDRLHLVLEAIDAETLFKTLDDEHQLRNIQYSARTLWSCLIAGVVYQITEVAPHSYRRHLISNPYTRACDQALGTGMLFLCGLSSFRVPSQSTFSRFLSRLVEHQDLLQGCIDDLVQRFARLALGFGERVAVDARARDRASGTSSTDVAAYSRGTKEGAAPCGVWPDPDAR
jgi:hypothetical protein